MFLLSNIFSNLSNDTISYCMCLGLMCMLLLPFINQNSLFSLLIHCSSGSVVRWNQKGFYNKRQTYVPVDKSASHNQLVETCAEIVVIDSESNEEGALELTFFWMDGTVVTDRPIQTTSWRSTWTERRYLQSLHKSASQMKFGVGYSRYMTLCGTLCFCCVFPCACTCVD